MGKVISFSFLIVLLFVGCNDDRDDNVTKANIRVRNLSSITFDSVQVGEAEYIHENVAPNGVSGYFEYEVAYEYNYIEIVSETGAFIYQPIDFVGETPLTPGFYTYELDVTEEGEVLLNFVVD
ncbi:MAG: hypothetical protein V7724_15410 [Sediminicola sp.]|tara:strand:+ start:121377 stop:121745 length:369 start_codon:yes stop_codon:yes gene_type:complete